MIVKRLNPDALKNALQKIGPEKIAQDRMRQKGVSFVFEIQHLPLSAALILKQEYHKRWGRFCHAKRLYFSQRAFL